MRVPQLLMTIDGTELTGPQAAAVLARVDVGMGRPHDRARLALGWQSPASDVTPGTTIEVAIGYDDPTPVLTGQVDLVSHRPWGLVVDVLAAPAKLSTTWVGRSYIELSAGDIVRDLLDTAGVEAGQIDGGPTLAAYHLDEHRSAWHHIQDLANQTGSEVSTEPGGALNFRPAPGAQSGGLGGVAGPAAAAATSLLGLGAGNRYGAELHDFAFGPAAELTPRPAVVANGAASQLGPDKWHILLGEPEGSSPDGPTLVPSMLRNQEGADQLAAAIDAAGDRATTRGWLRVTGNPDLRPGDSIEVTDMPNVADSSLRVRRLGHRVSYRSGFVTEIDVEGAAA